MTAGVITAASSATASLPVVTTAFSPVFPLISLVNVDSETGFVYPVWP